VQATNPTTTAMVYEISATCVKGIPITNGVWFAPIAQKDPNGNDSYISQTCPDPQLGVLTGGGFQSALNGLVSAASPGVVGAYPSEEQGVARKSWHLIVWDASGTIFALCAHGVFTEPLVAVNNLTDPGTSKVDLGVRCPTDEVLVGGGYAQLGAKGAGDPVTLDSTGIPDLTTWHAGYSSNNDIYLEVHGICIRARSNFKIPITISNYRHLIRIPAEQVVVATDGTGQVAATQETAHVTQARSGALAAVQSNNAAGPLYVVPAGCGDPSAAIDAVTAALRTQLSGQATADQVPFGDAGISINRDSLTCSPGAGTRQSTPFTYTQAIDGSAAQATYSPTAVRAYQSQQLQGAVRNHGGQYVLDVATICPQDMRLATASATWANIVCPAGGVVEWNWTPDALKGLARTLAGKTKAEALRVLEGIAGVEPDKSTIDLADGATLPTDPNNIIIVVIPPYDPNLLSGL
jgi:hypothetical protein